MKKRGSIISENWADYDGNYKSVICTDNLTSRELEHAVKSAYRQWRVHCAKKRQFRKSSLDIYYYQKFVTSLKKYGFFITLFKSQSFKSFISALLS